MWGFTCALLVSADVQCWGTGSFEPLAGGAGWLGLGYLTDVGDNEHPADVGPVPLGGKVLDMSVGMFHACALMLSGGVRCWGANDESFQFSGGLSFPLSGRLGIGSTASMGDDEPASASPIIQLPWEVTSICSSFWNNCVTTVSGQSMCWGGEDYGEAGVGRHKYPYSVTEKRSIGDDEVPWMQGWMQNGAPVSFMSCGTASQFIGLQGGGIRYIGALGEGRSATGKLRIADTRRYEAHQVILTPQALHAKLAAVSVLRLAAPEFTDTASIHIGDTVACALTRWKGVRCWGQNVWLRLGREEPSKHVGRVNLGQRSTALLLPGPVEELSVGSHHACARLQDTTVRCWGYNWGSRAGSGLWYLSAASSTPIALGGTPVAIAAGHDHSCAVLSSGQVQCWGVNVYGERFHPNSHVSSSGQPANAIASARQVCAGDRMTCLLLDDGRVQCVGNTYSGIQGTGSTFYTTDKTSLSTLNAVGTVQLSEPASSISCGAYHACAVLASGDVQCWGSGGYSTTLRARLGQPGLTSSHIGDNETPASLGPVQLSGPAVAVEAGPIQSCAVLATGHLQCWGRNFKGELFYGHTDTVGATITPHQAGLSPLPPTVQQVAAGFEATCVLLHGGHIRCVGDNAQGLLGSGFPGIVGQHGLPRYMLNPSPQVLDLGQHVAISSLLPGLRALGSVMQWASIAQVRSCPSCPMKDVESLPPWLMSVMRGAEFIDMLPPAASTGILCRQRGMPTRSGVDLCAPYQACSRDLDASAELQPFAETCVWPEDWSMDTILQVTAVTDQAAQGKPAVSPAAGGLQVKLVGRFWPLTILRREAVPFTVLIGAAPCTAPQLASVSELTCITPPLPSTNLTSGAAIRIEHSVPNVRSPVRSPPDVVVQYAPPLLSFVQPAQDVPVTGADVTVRGAHLGQTLSSTASVPWLLPLAAVHVAVLEHPLEAAPASRCNVTSVSVASIQCIMPPGLGTVWLRVTVAGQTALDMLQVSYAAPLVTSVVPATLLWSPPANASQASLHIHGSALGLRAQDLDVTVAGAPCGQILWHDSTHIECAAVNTSAVDTSASSGDVMLRVLPTGHEASLSAAVRVFGPMRVTGAAPLTVPWGGGAMTVFGLEFGLLGVGGSIDAVTMNGVPCTGVVVSASSLSCSLPPGVGGLSPIVVRRAAGAEAQFVSASLAYDPPRLSHTQPSVLSAALPGAQGTTTLTVYGQGFGQPGASPVQATVASQTCIVQHVSNTTLLCTGLNATALLAVASATVQVTVAGRPCPSPLNLRVLQKPSVAAMQPSVVTAAGGTEVTLLGVDFGGGALSDVQEVLIGAATCAILTVSSTSIRCRTPSKQAAGGSPVATTVRLASGFQDTLPNALIYTEAEIFRVEGGTLMPAARLGIATATLSAFGLALGAPGMASPGNVSIAGVDCAAAGGVVSLAANARSVTCDGLDPGFLPQQQAGSATTVQLVVTTNEGLQLTAPAGTVQLLGPPQVEALVPPQVRAGEAVAVLGRNFGLQRGDVQEVLVGSVPVPDEAWEWNSQGSISITAVPEPATLVLSSLVDLPVVLRLANGHSAVSTSPAVLTYDVPPSAPRNAPGEPCLYREGPGGNIRASFLWEDDTATRLSPVAAWIVHVSVQPWMEGGRYTQRVVPTSGESVGDVLVSDAGIGPCSHLRVDGRSASTRVIDLRILESPQRGPVFPQCLPAQYIATQHARQGRWGGAVCLACPDGAVCGGLPWEGMRAAAGYYRVPWSEHGLTFQRCTDPTLCPPAVNVRLTAQQLAYVRPQWNVTRPNSTSEGQHPGLPAAFQAQQLDIQAPADDGFTVQQGDASNSSATDLAVASNCVAGHTGPMCGKCAVGYGRLGTPQCAPCEGGSSRSIGLIFVFFVLMVAVVVWLVRGQVRTRGLSKKAHSVAKKVLVTHIQQTALMMSFDLEWPDPFKTLLAVSDTAAASSAQIASLDCVRSKEVPNAPSSSFRMQVLLTVAAPAIILSVCLLGAFGLAALKSRPDWAEARRRVIVAVLVVAFLFYTPLTRTVMQLFTCVSVGGEQRLLNDLEVLCDSSGNLAWVYGLGVPLLVVFVAGMP
ncbi:HERC2, partial [Symbiodinium sp. KB8]